MNITTCLLAMIPLLASMAYGSESATNPMPRSIRIDWVNHPGAKKVIAGAETWFGHCSDDMKVIPTGNFSDFNTGNWLESGVNSGNESMTSITDNFNYIHVDTGKFGTNTVTGSFTVTDGTVFSATYDFETVDRISVVQNSVTPKKLNRKMSKMLGPFTNDVSVQLKANYSNTASWSKSSTDFFSTSWSFGGKIGGTDTYNAKNAGDETTKSLDASGSINLSAGVESKIETTIGTKLESSKSISLNFDGTILIPTGKTLVVYSYIAANSYDLSTKEYLDPDDDGFPTPENPPSVSVTVNIPEDLGIENTLE